MNKKQTYETMTMDKPILERDTVDIVSTKLCYIDYIARGNDAVTYYAEDIPGYSSFHLTSMNATSIDGTFRWSEGNIDVIRQSEFKYSGFRIIGGRNILAGL